MKNQTLSIAMLLMVSFMLILMGSYLSSFQAWLTFNQETENVLNQPFALSSDVGGIGAISSSDAITTPINFTPPSLYVEKSTSESVNNLEQVLKPALEPALESSKTDSLVGVEAAGGEKILQSTLIHPTLIQYEEALVIEVPKVLATPSNLKRAINKVLLSPTVLSGQALLNAEPIKTQHKPWFYKQVINQYGQPIRYPAEATEYANFLLKEHTKEVVDAEGSFILVQIPLVAHRILTQVERYKPWVDEYADRFNVPKDLVFAIIEVESAFNPKAVSKSNALGLMQVKANAAGRDVYQYIDGRAGQPKAEDLFDAQNNLRMGIAYMGLLKHEYLQGVRNPRIKEMLSISSYNGGISRTLKLFGATPEAAVLRVNQLHPKAVYRTLRYEHTSQEARRYLDKVLAAKKRYSELLDLNA